MSRRCITLCAALLLCLSGSRAELNLDILLEGGNENQEDRAPANGTGSIAVPAPDGQTGTAPGPQNGGGTKQDALSFFSGEGLLGRLSSITADGVLTWAHADAADPIRFKTDNVRTVALAAAAKTQQTSDCVVRLTNGDEIPGRLVAVSATDVILATDYAGELRLRRPMVAALIPSARDTGTLYEGPAKASEWIASEQMPRRWEFRKNALYANQSNCMIGRDMKLPAAMRLDFELGWRMYPSISVALYTDKLGQMGGNSYLLAIQAEHVSLQRYTNNSSSGMGSHHVPTLQRQKMRSHISIRVDKEKKLVALFVDGTQVKQWTDAAGFAGGGTGIAFYASNPMQRIRNIRVTPWDGGMDGARTETPKAAEEDVIQFVNADKVTGTLVTITEGTVTFKTAYADLSVPFERVRTILVGTEGSRQARRNRGDVQAYFATVGRLTVQLTELAGGKIKGRSENLMAPLEADTDAFRKLRLNIYDDRQGEETTEDEW